MNTESRFFWERKTLREMTSTEWESLCDGCGRCCLHKLEDIDTGLYFYTNVVCRQLDRVTCQCRNYPQRRLLVKDCLMLTPGDYEQFNWLPLSCAYRRIHEGKPLEWWHPLVSGNPETVHEAGISVRMHSLSEEPVSQDELEDHIISWIDF